MGRLEINQRHPYQEKAHESLKTIKTYIEHPLYTIATRQKQVTTSEGSHYFKITGISQEEWEAIQKDALRLVNRKKNPREISPSEPTQVTENPQQLVVGITPNASNAIQITFYNLTPEKVDWYGIPEEYISSNGTVRTEIRTLLYVDTPGMATYAGIVAHAILQNRTAECSADSLKRILHQQYTPALTENPQLFLEAPLEGDANDQRLAPLPR